MVDPIGQKHARDAYLGRTEQSQAPQRAGTERVTRDRAASQATGDDAAAQVSEGLRQIQRAVDAVRQSPDVRAERVDALRRMIEAGEYDVPAEKVAAKLLGIDDADS